MIEYWLLIIRQWFLCNTNVFIVVVAASDRRALSEGVRLVNIGCTGFGGCGGCCCCCCSGDCFREIWVAVDDTKILNLKTKVFIDK